MRLYKRVAYSLSFAIIILFSSMILSIVPCKTAPVIPNPSFKWGFCSLNPDNLLLGQARLYFGFASKITEAYIITLLVSFILSILFLHFFARTKK